MVNGNTETTTGERTGNRSRRSPLGSFQRGASPVRSLRAPPSRPFSPPTHFAMPRSSTLLPTAALLLGLAVPAITVMVSPAPVGAQQPGPAAARITLDEAKRAVDAAEAEAVRNGWKLVFLITDAEGTPIYLRRMDGVPTRNYEIAMRKTHTVIASGMNTAAYATAVKEGRLAAIEGAVTYDGGLLLRRDGGVVGAFSASGARGVEDAQAVRAGMAAIGITPVP